MASTLKQMDFSTAGLFYRSTDREKSIQQKLFKDIRVENTTILWMKLKLQIIFLFRSNQFGENRKQFRFIRKATEEENQFKPSTHLCKQCNTAANVFVNHQELHPSNLRLIWLQLQKFTHILMCFSNLSPHLVYHHETEKWWC